MKIFVIYVGGKTETSLIELHDIFFIVAEKIEDTYEEVKAKWWGVKKGFHIDAWGILESAEDYNITLTRQPTHIEEKPYFVNLGGYDSKKFTELHKNVFVIAKNESKAKVKALRQILNWESHHKDYLYEVENCCCVNNVTENKELYIHLEKTDKPKEFEFTCKYTPLSN